MFSEAFIKGVIIQPKRLALALALLYSSVCIIYILGSTQIATILAANVGELQSIELIKGIFFILLTGLVFYLFASRIFRKIHIQQTEIREHQAAVIQSEQRALAGLFAASIGHDTNNILTVLYGNIELLKSTIDDPEGNEYLEDIQIALNRLRGMTRLLREVGKQSADEGELQSIRQIVVDSVDLARVHSSVKRCAVTVSIEDDCDTAVDVGLLHRMLLNLIINAADATGGEGHIDVVAREDSDAIVIEVHDDGPGVPQESRDRILEPFFTTKDTGVGLGLLAARLCVQRYDGDLEITDSPLGGACFRAVLRETNCP